MEEYKFLFTPIKLGPVTVKNRIVSSGHETGYGFFRKGKEPEKYVEYQRARAKGGCGLLISGCCVVEKGGGLSEEDMLTPGELTPRIRMLADALHPYGAKGFVQLAHLGKENTCTGPLFPTVGFSQTPGLTFKEMPHELESEEIEALIDAYAKYAEAVYTGGLDGVELHAGHGYLIQESWSPWANQRKDRWGEPLAFARELLKRVRARVGENFAVGFRISADDFLPGGMDVEKMKGVARGLEALGADFLNCTAGAMYGHYTIVIGPMYVPLGALVPLHSAIREGVDHVPVFASCRINDPLQAEKILAEGQADLVVMCRAQVADPEMANKAREGRSDEIRHCIACVQGCINRVLKGQEVACLQNPQTGREGSAPIEKAPKKKRVMVIGGGPAGMEAARVAAERGHDVSLYEKGEKLGGQVNIHTLMSFREEFREVVRWRELMLKKLGVKIHLNTLVDAAKVKELAPDAVVLATGSSPSPPPFPGGDPKRILNHEEVLLGTKPVAARVLLLDHTARMWGVHVADYLAEQGKEVRFVTPVLSPGIYLGATEMPITYQRLLRKGVQFLPHTDIREVSNVNVKIYNVYTQEESVLEDVDTIVYTVSNRVDKTMERELRKAVKELWVIGDCLAPRDTHQAIRDGFDCGRTI